MKIVLPNKNDLLDLRQLIETMPDAVGSVMGNIYKPSIDPRRLWVIIKIDREKASALWQHAEINTTGTNNAYSDMLAAEDHRIHITAFKYKVGLFKTIWVGNIDLWFADKQVFLGSVAGRQQYKMWSMFRAFLELKSTCHDGTTQAIYSLALN